MISWSSNIFCMGIWAFADIINVRQDRRTMAVLALVKPLNMISQVSRRTVLRNNALNRIPQSRSSVLLCMVSRTCGEDCWSVTRLWTISISWEDHRSISGRHLLTWHARERLCAAGEHLSTKDLGPEICLDQPFGWTLAQLETVGRGRYAIATVKNDSHRFVCAWNPKAKIVIATINSIRETTFVGD